MPHTPIKCPGTKLYKTLQNFKVVLISYYLDLKPHHLAVSSYFHFKLAIEVHPFLFVECDLSFDNASTLYTHAAGKHYYAQLVELFKSNFMRTNGMCSACPNRPINDQQVRHFFTYLKIV